jgi:pimeloyl-ACP methyl ester carboxylesterase
MSVWIKARVRLATVAGALGCAFALLLTVPTAATAASAAEPPPRRDTTARPVIFIHGIQLQPWGMRCDKVWDKTMKAFEDAGWKKRNLITFGYYGDSPQGACDVQYKGDLNSDIEWVAGYLNQFIWENYGRYGKSVDIVAHSMGGLIAREAIMQARKAKPQQDVFVEDVITMGTPFLGSGWSDLCAGYSLQCRQMRKGSGYILSRTILTAAGLHNARGGTDWTAIGSETDDVVSPESAVGPDPLAKHHVQYLKPSKVHHTGRNSYYNKEENEDCCRARISNNFGEDYVARPELREPNHRAPLAAYFESDF